VQPAPAATAYRQRPAAVPAAPGSLGCIDRQMQRDALARAARGLQRATRTSAGRGALDTHHVMTPGGRGARVSADLRERGADWRVIANGARTERQIYC
jgi:hypothetical protein